MLQGVALFLYLLFDGLVSLYVISALFGLFQGGIVPMYAIIVREYFAPSEAGTRLGIVLMATLGRHGARRLDVRRDLRPHRLLHGGVPQRARLEPDQRRDRGLAADAARWPASLLRRDHAATSALVINSKRPERRLTVSASN